MTRRRPTAVVLVLLLVVGLAVAALTAAPEATAADDCTVSWTGGAGAWSDATRWSPARVPTTDDRACVVRAAGAPPVTVRVTGPSTTSTGSLTLRGATLAVAADSDVDVSVLRVADAALTGGGSVSGWDTQFTDTRFGGVWVTAGGRLDLGGRCVFTGGTRMNTTRDSGFVVFRDGTRVLDGDGDPANRITIPLGVLYPQSMFVGVHLALGDVTLLAASGRVVLGALDNLAPDGTLTADRGADLFLGAANAGELVLTTAVTRIGRHVHLDVGTVTHEWTDALASLTAVDGDLVLRRPLTTTGPLTVNGAVVGVSTLSAPSLRVGGHLETPVVTGTLTCGGVCHLAGSDLGDLVLQAGSTAVSDVTAPVTVRGRATLAGTLSVVVPQAGRPRVGDTVVLLAAAGGVRGTFAAVQAGPRRVVVVPGYQPTYVTGTLGTPTG